MTIVVSCCHSMAFQIASPKELAELADTTA